MHDWLQRAGAGVFADKISRLCIHACQFINNVANCQFINNVATGVSLQNKCLTHYCLVHSAQCAKRRVYICFDDSFACLLSCLDRILLALMHKSAQVDLLLVSR